MATKIEGFAQAWNNGRNWWSVELDAGYPVEQPCTLVVHDASLERVFTESEVRAMLKEVSTSIYRGRIGESPQHTIKAIAERHGFVLDPA